MISENQSMTIEISSDVAGSVWKIAVEIGEKITEGQVLIVLESMKMEIPVIATASGTVTEILVMENDIIEEDQPVVTVDPESS